MLLALGEVEEQRAELEQELAAVGAALGDAHDKIRALERPTAAPQVKNVRAASK